MNKQLLQKIGFNLKKYRKIKNLRQIDVAADADISLGMVSLIEIAHTDVTVSKLNAIAEALGIELWQLVKFDEND